MKRAIESVEAQNMRDLEAIVIDDGSDDGTSEVVQAYANCRYVKIEHSGLPAVARNAGARVTDARYLAFLDSDDEWLPSKLERQLEEMQGTSFGLVCSNALLNGKQPYLRPGQTHRGRVLKDLLADNFVITSSVLVRRDVFEQAGGFCEDSRLRGIEDYDLWLRIAALADLHYLDEELILYIQADDNLSRTRSLLSYWQGMEFIFSRVAKTDGVAAILSNQLAACKTAMCNEYLASGQYREFTKMFADLWRIHPMAAAKYPATLSRTLLRKLSSTG